jgi:hypothetical protein
MEWLLKYRTGVGKVIIGGHDDGRVTMGSAAAARRVDSSGIGVQLFLEELYRWIFWFADNGRELRMREYE